MSAKWIRSKRWDEEHLRGPFTPVKWVLRALSSVSMAVVLLVGISLYGVLASVPIGLIAQAPTWAVYGLTLAAVLAAVALVPTWLAWRAMRRGGIGFGPRFVSALVMVLALGAAGVIAWSELAWPHLRYHPSTGRGLMFFAGFVAEHGNTTLRRLPGVELTELEFYAAWPMRLMLYLLVLNLIVATLRRIEFNLHNIGVLTVHTGIVTIALGSAYYTRLKQEGDVLLQAGDFDPAQGRPGVGPPVSGFYDDIDVAIWIRQLDRESDRQAVEMGMPTGEPTWREEQRPIRGVPRYNNYNVDALGLAPPMVLAWANDEGRKLDIPVSTVGATGVLGPIDTDLRFRVVGYVAYGETHERWVDPSLVPPAAIDTGKRRVELMQIGPQTDPTVARTVPVELTPSSPKDRVHVVAGGLSIEHTRGMSDDRFHVLSRPMPPGVARGAAGGSAHGLYVEVERLPGAPGGDEPVLREVYAIQRGTRIVASEAGYTIEVEAIHDRSPMPIITKGYEGADSPVAIVKVTPPPGPDGSPGVPFRRFVYARFPEINQDIFDADAPGQAPRRADPDPRIKLSLIDASVASIVIDERADGSFRAVVRLPGAGEPATPNGPAGERLIVEEDIPPGRVLALNERVGLRVSNAVCVTYPVAPPSDQLEDPKALGTHRNALLGVEVSLANDPEWKKIMWLPFAQFQDIERYRARSITLPDGRELELVFGRARLALPGLSMRLADFEMIAYEHSDIPQDYRSDLLVFTNWNVTQGHDLLSTSLNHPLLIRVPFQWRQEVPWVANAVQWGVSRVAPMQYKFSQAGWDSETWEQTAQAAQRGEVPRAFSRWTILGVGNNPGIRIIFIGGTMMGIGIPWAFYIKPLLVRRRRDRLRRQLSESPLPADRTPIGDAP